MDENVTVFLCGPNRECQHDYCFVEAIFEDGKFVGDTTVCGKCGTRAIDEAMWNDD